MKLKTLMAARLMAMFIIALATITITYRNVMWGVSLVEVFSYFTMQVCLFVIWVLAASLLLPKSPKLDLLRGAATLYVVMIGIIYHALLVDSDVLTGKDWVNVVVHALTPLWMIIDWLIDPPAKAIPIKRALLWTVYPVIFTIYTLLRGEMTVWYPYPFMNVANKGYMQVFVFGSVIFGLFAVLTVVVAQLPGLLGRRSSSHLKVKK